MGEKNMRRMDSIEEKLFLKYINTFIFVILLKFNALIKEINNNITYAI
jgi:hypothetical protein